MHFLIDFSLYLAAFGLGAALTWLIAARFVPLRSEAAAWAHIERDTEVEA